MRLWKSRKKPPKMWGEPSDAFLKRIKFNSAPLSKARPNRVPIGLARLDWIYGIPVPGVGMVRPKTFGSDVPALGDGVPTPGDQVDLVERFRGAAPRPAKRLYRVPDTVTTIKAYRAWRVRDGSLYAAFFDTPWPKTEPMRAACSHGGLTVCRACGIHACKTPEAVCDGYKIGDRFATACAGEVIKYRPGRPFLVMGVVELWGSVKEFKLGYRAEFGYPAELWIVDPAHEAIAAEYGCNVRCL